MKISYIPRMKSHHPMLGDVSKMLITMSSGNSYGIELDRDTNKVAVSDKTDATYGFPSEASWDYLGLDDLITTLNALRPSTINLFDERFWEFVSFLQFVLDSSVLRALCNNAYEADSVEIRNSRFELRKTNEIAKSLLELRKRCCTFIVRMNQNFYNLVMGKYYLAYTDGHSYIVRDGDMVTAVPASFVEKV